MAAHLDLTLLRRHALPAHFLLKAACQIARPAYDPQPPRGAVRPTLRAIWHVGACGRPVCTWSLDTGDPGSLRA